MSDPSPRIVALTGAETPLGRATAKALRARNCRVFSVGGYDAELATWEVEHLPADLTSPADLAAATALLASRATHLDGLLHLGLHHPLERELTPQGEEKTMAVNVLAGFRLMVALRPLLAEAGGRVVVLTPACTAPDRIDWQDLTLARDWSPARALTQSAALTTLVTAEAARRLAPVGIAVNALAPGITRAGVAPGASDRLSRLARRLPPALLPSPRGVYRAAVALAISRHLQGFSGNCFTRLQAEQLRIDPGLGDRAWVLMELLASG